MAKHVLRAAHVSINSVDLSDHVRSVTISTNRPEVDVTSMGASFQEFVAGIPDATITVEFYQDYATGEVWVTHDTLYNSDTPFPIVIRPDSGAASATNPSFEMSALMMGDYSPLAGDVGSANMTSITYRNASQTGLQALPS